MNPYELLYIVSTSYTDAETSQIQEQIALEITRAGGAIIRNENLGKIRLAYPIKKQHHGSYILVYFAAEPSIISALNRKLSLTDTIMRHTIGMRPAGVETKKVELSSYVAPLSEEARRQRFDSSESPRPVRRRVEELPPPAPSVTSTQEQKMSMEDLDKKLDELLEADVTKNV